MLHQWYGIMPNKVLFDKNLSDKQKLLFVLISSLCAEKWHCRASNRYFSEKLWFSETWVSKQIADLEKQKYIRVKVDKNWWNARAIELEFKTYWTGVQDPIELEFKHNSINIITTKEDIKNLLSQEEIKSNEKSLIFLWDMIVAWYWCVASKKNIMKEIEWIKETLKVYKYYGDYNWYDRDRARMKLKEMRDCMDAGMEVKNFKLKLNNFLSPNRKIWKQKK